MPDASALLDLNSTTKGLLIPRPSYFYVIPDSVVIVPMRKLADAMLSTGYIRVSDTAALFSPVSDILAWGGPIVTSPSVSLLRKQVFPMRHY